MSDLLVTLRLRALLFPDSDLPPSGPALPSDLPVFQSHLKHAPSERPALSPLSARPLLFQCQGQPRPGAAQRQPRGRAGGTTEDSIFHIQTLHGFPLPLPWGHGCNNTDFILPHCWAPGLTHLVSVHPS
jgi:hypothetical protein